MLSTPSDVSWRSVTLTGGPSISTGSFFWLPNVLGCFAISGFRLSNRVTPASFALIERVDQFLNERTQFGRVAFICNRSTEFAPVPFHVVSHISSPTTPLRIRHHFKRTPNSIAQMLVLLSARRSSRVVLSFKVGSFTVRVSLYYRIGKRSISRFSGLTLSNFLRSLRESSTLASGVNSRFGRDSTN